MASCNYSEVFEELLLVKKPSPILWDCDQLSFLEPDFWCLLRRGKGHVAVLGMLWCLSCCTLPAPVDAEDTLTQQDWACKP